MNQVPQLRQMASPLQLHCKLKLHHIPLLEALFFFSDQIKMAHKQTVAEPSAA